MRTRFGAAPRGAGVVALAAALVLALALATNARPARGDTTSGISVEGPARIAVAAPGPWAQTFYVYVDGAGDVAIDAAASSAPPLQDAAGRQVPVTLGVTPSQGRFDALQPLAITLRANLDRAGTYTTTLRVRGGKGIAALPIAVDVGAATPRAPDPALVAIDKTAASLEAERGLVGTAPIELSLSVRNDAHRPFEIASQTIALVERTDGGHDVETAARLDAVDVAGSPSSTIGPGEIARLVVSIADVEGPGRFTGVLRLVPRDPTLAPADLAIEVYLRRSWLVCALLIALGAVIAYLVRSYREQGRARTVRRIKLGASVDRLRSLAAGAASSQAVAAGRALEVEARVLGERAARDDDGLDGVLASFDARVTLFGRYVAIDAVIAQLPAAERDAKRAALDAIAATIMNGAADLAAIAKAGADLDDLKARDAMRTWLATWQARLTRDVQEHADSSDAALATAMREELGPMLAGARRAAAADDLDGLRAALDQAQRALIDHGARALERALATAPAGLDAAAWTPIAAQLRAQLGALQRGGELDELVATYAKARRGYLVAVARGVIVAADRVLDDPAASAITKEKVQKGRDALDAACGDDTVDAAAVVAATEALREILDGIGARIAATSSAFAPGDIGAAGAAPAPTTLAVATAAPRDWERLAARLRRSDQLVLLVVGVLGVLSGLEVLWFADATWGGAKDLLTAFLWGAGVHASADAFLGLLKLRDELGKP